MTAKDYRSISGDTEHTCFSCWILVFVSRLVNGFSSNDSSDKKGPSQVTEEVPAAGAVAASLSDIRYAIR